jgi:hypothetical protein
LFGSLTGKLASVSNRYTFGLFALGRLLRNHCSKVSLVLLVLRFCLYVFHGGFRWSGHGRRSNSLFWLRGGTLCLRPIDADSLTLGTPTYAIRVSLLNTRRVRFDIYPKRKTQVKCLLVGEVQLLRNLINS